MFMSLDLFKYFYEAARHENISEAAKALYTSQPVVSKYIHRLEKELNTQLFIRTSRGVALTEEGHILFDYVRSALSDFENGTNEIKRMHLTGAGQIRIGVSTTLCKYLLLPFLKKYIERNPNVRISIQCQSTWHTLELLEQGRIDIGLIGRPEKLHNMTFFEMMEIEDIFVATDTYLENHGILNIQNSHHIFNAATLMLLDQNNITRQYIDTYLTNNNIRSTNLLEISSMDLIIEFAKISMGIGCVIKEFVRNEIASGVLTEIPLATPIPRRKVGFAIKKQTYMPVALRLFLEMTDFF